MEKKEDMVRSSLVRRTAQQTWCETTDPVRAMRWARSAVRSKSRSGQSWPGYLHASGSGQRDYPRAQLMEGTGSRQGQSGVELVCR